MRNERARVALAVAVSAVWAGGWPAPGSAQTPEPSPAPVAQEAAPANPDEPLPLRFDDQVTVTAVRDQLQLREIPSATSVVDAVDLAALPRGIAAEEALRMVPGVKTDNQADGERVHLSIRGQGLLTERGVRGIAVLLDGLPVNDPSGFAPDLFDVDWDAVDRIEVVRGVSSSLYGCSSAGGVIQVVTRDGAAGPTQGRATLTGGSHAFGKAYGDASGTAGKLGYRISASANGGDGYRDHTAFHAANVYGKGRLPVGERGQLTFVAGGTGFYNENAEGLNLGWLAQDRRQANPDALTYDEYQRTRRLLAGLTGNLQVAPGQAVSLGAGYRRTGWQESVPSSVQHRTYDTPTLLAQYSWERTVGSVVSHASAGFDAGWQWIDEHKHPNLGQALEGPELLSSQAIRQRGLAVRAAERLDLGHRWSLSGSLRGDWLRNELTDELGANGVDLSGRADFSDVTGRLGLTYNPRSELGLYASWGTGFLPPATEELANNPERQGGFNPRLVPATSRGGELGVRGSWKRRVTWDLTVFHLDTQNDFGRYRVPGRPLETFYGNLGSSSRWGGELAFGLSLSSGLRVSAAYTFSDFRYTEVVSLFGSFHDTVMPNAPRHMLGLEAEYRLGRHWELGVMLDGQTEQYVDQANLAVAQGYLLVHPRLAFHWDARRYAGSLMLVARNLLGEEYIAFTEPDPDGNSYQPGPTREVFLGLRIETRR